MNDQPDDDDADGGRISAHRNDEEWRCVDCGNDWPCLIFRRRLLALYADEPDRLRTFMRHFRDRAAADLAGVTRAQLDGRFLGWVDGPPAPSWSRRSI